MNITLVGLCFLMVAVQSPGTLQKSIDQPAATIDLSVRDRSLVTIAALAAMGDDDQLDLYLGRAIESGLTRAQIAEALTHRAFYAGWPKATKAMTAVTRSLGK
jgi:alkylhydroperoxidase/carboxymuconolactone decarboxylase family protein YurZ